MMRSVVLVTMLIGTALLLSCNPDDTGGGKVVASFQFEASEDNFLEIEFINFSKNADSYSWDFGDGNTSTDADPIHVYAAAGTYTVTLTASNDKGEESVKEEEVAITDPDVALTLLAGLDSKMWKLYRVGTSMGVGASAANPYEYFGLTNNGTRNCLYEQTFTFERDGDYVFDDNGGFWGEFGVFNGRPNYEQCFDATAGNMINKDGADVSAWLSGTHSFSYNVAAGKVTLSGNGAWIGVPKLGTSGETTVPVSEVTFDVVITEEDGYDLMAVIFNYASISNYWQINYVSYDDWNDEPPLDPTPVAGFTFERNEENPRMFTFTNTSNANAVTFDWDFGDGNSSTDENPVYTYDEDGTYTVTLTVANSASDEDTYSEIVTTLDCTEETSADVTSPVTGLDITWYDDNAHFGQFGNIGSARVTNPFANEDNPSCYAFRYTKTTGCETWSGMSYLTPGTFNFTSQNDVFTMQAYGVNQGTTVKMRFEKNAYPDVDPSVEREATLTTSGEWQTLTFDFSDDVSNNNYTVMLIYFEQGAACDGDVYYFDNLVQGTGN
mgnify:CR=1 FL=1